MNDFPESSHEIISTSSVPIPYLEKNNNSINKKQE